MGLGVMLQQETGMPRVHPNVKLGAVFRWTWEKLREPIVQTRPAFLFPPQVD